MSRVLLVDDSLSIRETFAIYLQNEGFDIFKASNVAEATEALNWYKPQLIVLDIVMEGKSGFEFCYQLKKNKDTCSISIAICSSKSTPADLLLCDMVGADAFFPKTISQNDFITRVKQLTQKNLASKL